MYSILSCRKSVQRVNYLPLSFPSPSWFSKVLPYCVWLVWEMHHSACHAALQRHHHKLRSQLWRCSFNRFLREKLRTNASFLLRLCVCAAAVGICEGLSSALRSSLPLTSSRQNEETTGDFILAHPLAALTATAHRVVQDDKFWGSLVRLLLKSHHSKC